MVQEWSFRRNRLRWSPAELDRLLRAVKLEDVTLPLARFNAIAGNLERTPQSARSMWLELRDAALRGKRASSPAVVAYVRRRFPELDGWDIDDSSLDALVCAYREAQRKANLLLDRIIMFAAAENEALSGLKQTLFGTVGEAASPARQPIASYVEGEEPRAGSGIVHQPAA